MNKDIKQIKQLLHLHSFRPHSYSGSVNVYRKSTHITFQGFELYDEFIESLMKRCGETNISECYFIGGRNNSIFFLNKFFKSDDEGIFTKGKYIKATKYYYNVGFAPSNIDDDTSDDDLLLFLNFIEEGNSKYVS